jgi:hypothetical protein
MKEIHEIRLKNYEKTKNMTREEKIININARAAKAKLHIEELRQAVKGI